MWWIILILILIYLFLSGFAIWALKEDSIITAILVGPTIGPFISLVVFVQIICDEYRKRKEEKERERKTLKYQRTKKLKRLNRCG